MPKYSRNVLTVLCLALVLTYAMSAIAQTRITNTTFGGAVQLPGVLLPAGTYQFSLAQDRGSVVVSAADHRVIATLVVIPVTRSKAGATVTMLPSDTGAAPKLAALYSDGGTTGVQFVYPKVQK